MRDQAKTVNAMDLSRGMKIALTAGIAYKAGTYLSSLMGNEHSLQTTSRSQVLSRIEDRFMTAPTQNSYFINKDGLRIFYRKWAPIKGFHPLARGVVVISHGLGEHCGRYEHVAKHLNKAGLVVYALDHQGHGRSEGDRLHVKFFNDFVQDVLQLTEIAKSDYRLLQNKLFLLGHSMGGIIAIQTARASPKLWQGVIISSPALGTKDMPEVGREIIKVLSKALPKLKPAALNIDTLCRDPMVVDLYMNDPLVDHGNLSTRIVGELFLQQEDLVKNSKKIEWPFLLMQGGIDKLVFPPSAVNFFESTSSKDKTFKFYQESFHEIFNEPDCMQNACSDTTSWITARL